MGYVDDVLVFSPTLEEHISHVTQVLTALHQAGLMLKLTKCRLFCQQVKYLGHLITSDGLLPIPSQTAAIISFPIVFPS